MRCKIKWRRPQHRLKRQRREQVNQKIKLWNKRKLRKREIKKIQEYEERIRELTDAIKWNNVRIIENPEEEEREKGAEGVLEQIVPENFPNMGKETDIEIQEAQRTPFRCNLNRFSARYIIVKLAKYMDKERILKAARDKCALTYKGRLIRLVMDLSTELGRPERNGRKSSM